MIKRLIALCLVLALSGCADFRNAVSVLEGTAVSPAAVYIASNGFDAAEATATNYLTLPRCAVTSPALCRSPAATKQIIPAVRAGRKARDDLKAFLAANPGQLGPTGLYNALTAATGTLHGVFQIYNIGGTQ